MSVVDLFQQIARNDFGFFKQVRTADDVMSANPPCLSLDDSLQTATEKFRRAAIDHAPVVNPEDNEIVGIVSERDLLRNHPRLLGKAAEQDDDHKALQASVTRFMTRNPVWCTADTSPIQVMTLLLDHRIDSVLVSSDGKKLEGIVTPDNFIQTLLLYHRVCTRDFSLRRLRLVDLDLKNGVPLDEIFSTGAQTVRDVMTKNVKTLHHDDHLTTAMEKMQEHEIRHLPILNPEGKPSGMLSDKDILKFLPIPKGGAEETESRFREKLFATDDTSALHQRVDHVMGGEVRSVEPGMLLTDALNVFAEKSTCGLSVVDRDSGELCGIVTKSDIIRVFRVVMQIGCWASDSETDDAASAELATV